MSLRPLRRSVPFLAFLLPGCATINVDGYKLNPDIWRSDDAEIRRMASFELKCDEGRLILAVLATGRGDNTAGQVGVEGCGRRLVYSLVYSEHHGTWVRSVGDAEAK
jgi:hypothetical protein